MRSDLWEQHTGRDLDPLPIEPGKWKRVVACLNIWNDLTELRANIESWYPWVDHVIAVDGAYAGTNAMEPESTDGTLEYLRDLSKVQLVECAEFWPDQCLKRSEYFRRALPGDLLVRIDADERFENFAAIRGCPDLDVGWVRYTSPIYKREQNIPIAFAYRPGLQYRMRHHWVFDGDRPVSTQQRGGDGYLHMLLPIEMSNSRGSLREERRINIAHAQRRNVQVRLEQAASPLRVMGHEPLRVLQLGQIDPGIAIARLHSALNTTTPHTSVMAIERTDWIQAPRQYDLKRDGGELRLAAKKADIIHLHLNFTPLQRLLLSREGLARKLVIHHHGTLYRRGHKVLNRMAQRTALQLVSNLELLQYGDKVEWLPNAVPVARYQRLAAQRPPWEFGLLRIAHSPTKRHLKATPAFESACATLRAKGLQIEPVMIEQQPWREALVLKASCHVTFDSFWLGMQCSGLEGAAMGQPVIAGDDDCRREYESRYGSVPYTWANDEAALVEQLERLATDHDYYAAERDRVGAFVVEHHDYAAVAARYLDLLDAAIGWRKKLGLGVPARLRA